MAAWRMAISAAALGLGAAWRRRRKVAVPLAVQEAKSRYLPLIALAGVFIALHFSFFYSALRLTTVLRATLLVCLVPIFVGLLGFVSFPGSPASRPPASFWAGIALALVGVRFVVMGPGGPEVRAAAQTGALLNTGDIFALLGAVAFAVYMRIGRIVRKGVPVRSYQLRVTAVAAAMLLPAAQMLHGSVAVPVSAWPWLAVASLLPQLIGQAGLDFVLFYLSPRIVSAATLMEPICASLLAWAFFGEAVSQGQAFGSLLVLAAVGVVAASER